MSNQMMSLLTVYPDIIAPNPSIIKGFVILLPTKTPIDMPTDLFLIAIIDVVSSGNAVPTPTNNVPINVSLTFQIAAKNSPFLTTISAEYSNPNKPANNIRVDANGFFP